MIWNVFLQNQSLYDFCAHSQDFSKSMWNQREKKKFEWISNITLKIYFRLVEIGVWCIILLPVLFCQICKSWWVIK